MSIWSYLAVTLSSIAQPTRALCSCFRRQKPTRSDARTCYSGIQYKRLFSSISTACGVSTGPPHTQTTYRDPFLFYIFHHYFKHRFIERVVEFIRRARGTLSSRARPYFRRQQSGPQFAGGPKSAEGCSSADEFTARPGVS